MDYRKRCYQNYVSTQGNYVCALSKEAYELYSKISRKRFKNILPSNKEAKIIDVSCGPGHFLYFLQKEGYLNTQGIDLSEEQLQVARQMGVKNLEKADLFQYLPEHPESFEVIVAHHTIEHLKKDEILNFLDTIYGSLVSGGKVLISTLNAQSLFGASLIFSDFTHEQGFTPVSLAQVLRLSHFKNVSIYGETPVIYDLRSALRSGFWWFIKNMLKLGLMVERGTGRGLWKHNDIFEPRIFALGEKGDGK